MQITVRTCFHFHESKYEYDVSPKFVENPKFDRFILHRATLLLVYS